MGHFGSSDRCEGRVRSHEGFAHRIRRGHIDKSRMTDFFPGSNGGGVGEQSPPLTALCSRLLPRCARQVRIYLRAAELHSTDKLPQGAAFSTNLPVQPWSPSASASPGRGEHLRLRRSRPEQPPSRQTMPRAACGTRARGWSDAGGRATACPVNVGLDGIARTACTDFLELFVGHSAGLRGVC